MQLRTAIKKSTEFLIMMLIEPSVFIWFWFIRWIKQNRLLAGLGDKQIGRHSIFYIPFAYIDRMISFFKSNWNAEFSNYALKKYENFLKTHYSKDGIGYFNYDGLSEDERLNIYNGVKGRVAYYIEHNLSILDYKDGDSFLDMGCGQGQNIKELVSRYPNSLIKGFDVSKGALRIIQTALKKNNNVNVEEGSVIDLQYLDSYPARSFDHVIVSHVFSFLIRTDVNETRILRQKIMDQLIRIAAKSALIMDANILSGNKYPELIIEQNTRCHFRESLVPYFSKHVSKGELYAMFSPENEAVVFKLR